jgi:hypothetical protein
VKPESLRSEFILTGGATLLSVYLLVVSVQRRSRTSCFFHGRIMRTCNVHPFAVPDQLKAAGTAAVAITILIGLAFVVGIIVVQVTFFFPTEGLIHVRRRKRLCELRSLDHKLRQQYEPSSAGHLVVLTKVFSTPEPASQHGSFREFINFYVWKLFKHTDSLTTDESLVLNIGRQLAPDTVIREYEYRRSNRQIFVGILPAFVITIIASIVNPWSSREVVQVTWTWVIIIIGTGMIYALFASANYQERVAQAQLLDTAFSTLWSQCGDGVTTKDQVADGQTRTAVTTVPEPLRRYGMRKRKDAVCASK